MSLYVIADLHLSTLPQTNKSMEVFGRRWDHYMERIESNWRALVTDADTVVIPGDVSWALSLEEAVSDLRFLDALPGKKILGKGNHDFWWCTMKKHEKLFERENIKTLSFLFNNAHETDAFILAGSRGWFSDDESGNMQNAPDVEKINARELMRLRASLEAADALQKNAPQKELLVFTHFPPVWGDRANEPFFDLCRSFGVKRVYYGHVHGAYTAPSTVVYRETACHLIAADHLAFIPKFIHPIEISDAFSEEIT